MKKILLFIILFSTINSFSQSFKEFNSDNFKIQFPDTWIVVPREKMPELALVAYRKPESATDRSQVTINMNIINTPNSTLDNSFSDLLSSLKDGDDYKLLENGNSEIYKQSYKWLKESHSNYAKKDQKMYNYVFLTYKDNKTYVLTMAAFSEVFDTYKPVFDKIANGLIIN